MDVKTIGTFFISTDVHEAECFLGVFPSNDPFYYPVREVANLDL
ncbi:MAG: hypothetical protein U9Q00_01620 [Synergistota bacterium]|nr:hypothetical protein [Synergistota bacterium]